MKVGFKIPHKSNSKQLSLKGGFHNAFESRSQQLSLKKTITLAGQVIAQHILQLPVFQRATTLGVYLHCAKLREVDTALVVAAAVQAGMLLPVLHLVSLCVLLHLKRCCCCCYIGGAKAYLAEPAGPAEPA